MRRKTFLVLKILIGAFFFFVLLFYLISWYGFRNERKDAEFGVTFSAVMARQLGLDPKKTFDALIRDLGVRRIRLPLYWTDIEPQEGEFDFSLYDYFIKEAEESHAKLILAVGRKLPRWPECFVPVWAQFERGDIDETSFKYIKAVVGRYKDSPAIEYWQVENEPFHVFGSGCAAGIIEKAQVEREIALIRSLAHSPILLTDSGEQGIWSTSLRRADLVGASMYLQVWNKVFGYVYFPFGPGFYSMKREFFHLFFPSKKIIVSELQTEPWGPGKLLPDYDIKIQKALMGRERFREVISYARRSSFDTFYLWGAEWWYWLKDKEGDPSLWDEAKLLF